MFFPRIETIATLNVISISPRATLSDALEAMLRHDLRDIVIEKDHQSYFGILSDNDVIQLRMGKVDFSLRIDEIHYRRLPQVMVGENILEAMRLFTQEHDYLCVVNEQEALCGIVSYTDIIANIDPRMVIEQQKIGDFITKNIIQWVNADDCLTDVMGKLHNVSDALVVCSGGGAVGVVTTRETIKAIQSGQELNQPVSKFMTSPLQTVSEHTSIRESIEIITQQKIKRLFVDDANGTLIGMVTQRELVTQAYNKWSEIVSNHLAELEELVGILQKETVSLEKRASTDLLTGLSNRAHFEIKLQEEIDRQTRYMDSPFALIVLDVDHFKQFNDSRGHAFGDKVLKQIAEVIQKNGRNIDTQSRWGGDEFVILMPSTTIDGAKIHAERLRSHIEQVTSTVGGYLSISAGIGEYIAGETADVFFKRVDQLLYSAKTKGRNRVEHSHVEA